MRLHIAPDARAAQPTLPPPVSRPARLTPEPTKVSEPPKIGPKEAAKRAEELTGEPVGILPVDLNLVRAAMLEGVLVDASLHCWRGSTALKPADMGLSGKAAEASKAQSSGETIWLIPEAVGKRVDAADTKMRRALRDNGFRIQGYRGWFIPATGWDGFKETFDAGVADFNAAVDDLCKNLDSYREGVQKHLRELAPRAWRGHRETWDELGTCQPGSLSRVEEPTSTFVEWFVTNFAARIPTAEIIRDSAQVTCTRNILHVPEISAALNVARSHAGMRDELVKSLEEQRDSLPMRFIEGVAGSVLAVLQKCFTAISRNANARPGSMTRAVTAVRKAIDEARRGNLTKDPRIEVALANLDRELRTAEARASGAQRSMMLDEILAPTRACIEVLSTLTRDLGDEK